MLEVIFSAILGTVLVIGLASLILVFLNLALIINR